MIPYMSNTLILVVEDSEDDERLTLRALRGVASPYTVKVARDGSEAAEMLGLGSVANPTADRPVLVLLDIQMPKLNGLDLLKMIRRDTRMSPITVVIFSSSDQKEDIDRAHELHAEYQQKPMEYAEYMDSVKRVVKRVLQSAGHLVFVA